MLIQPLVVFWWLLPGVGDLTLGNDYGDYAIDFQLELLFSVFNGTYPLFVPGFHHGQTAAALSLGELQHPLAWIASMMPGYWAGHALSWNTALRLLSLGCAHLALLKLLQRLGLAGLLAWVLSTAVVYNLRMLDHFRFAAGLEAYTGMLLLVAALGWYFYDRRQPLAPLAVAAAGWWMAASGHPQLALFGLLGAATAALALPALVRGGWRAPALGWPGSWRFHLRWAGWLALGLGVCAALALPFAFEYLAQNSSRVGQDYRWAIGYSDSLAGLLANFFLPLRSEVHGAFGGPAILLVPALLPVVVLVGVRLSRASWLLWGSSLLVFLYTMGPLTPVHRLVWLILPFASSFRVPGRLSSLLPLLLVLLLLTGVKDMQRAAASRSGGLRSRPTSLLCGLALVLYAVFPLAWWLSEPLAMVLTPLRINQVGLPYEAAVYLLGLLGIACLAPVLRGVSARWPGLLLAASLLLQVGLVMARGTWLEQRSPTVTWEIKAERKRSELEYFYGDHGQGDGLESDAVRQHSRRGAPFHRELARLCTSPTAVASLDDAYELVLADRRPRGACAVEAEIPPSDAAPRRESGLVELRWASFNRQLFSVHSDQPSWLVVHHPFTPHWRASVDGRPVSLARVDGLELGIPVPAGEVSVDLRYWSWATLVGVLLASGSLAGLALLLLPRLLPGQRRGLLLALALLAGSLPSAGWAISLYSGRPLGTRYTWRDGHAQIPQLPPDLVPEPQICRSQEGFEVPCSY